MPKRSDTKPWERQEGESVKAFEAFCIYLNLGTERSITKVVQELNKSRALIGRWSSAFGWVERAAAYDADLQRKARAQAVKNARKMNDRHVKIALQMQEKALAALAQMRPSEIDPKDLIAMLREATKLERESRLATIEEDRRVAATEDTTESEDDVVVYMPDNGRESHE